MCMENKTGVKQRYAVQEIAGRRERGCCSVQYNSTEEVLSGFSPWYIGQVTIEILGRVHFLLWNILSERARHD
jgi:hypothetical protein